MPGIALHFNAMPAAARRILTANKGSIGHNGGPALGSAKMPSPTISVITVVFNRVETIGHALESVASQSYPHVEHVVVDGASSDGTLEEIERRRTAAMRVISEPDDGIYDAINKGMTLASGDVLGLAHSDDELADRDVLADVAQAFSDPLVDAVYGDLVYVRNDRPSEVLRHWVAGAYAPAKLARGWMPPHPTLFIRRRVVEAYGQYDISYQIAADYEAVLRWFSRGLEVRYVPRVLVRMRTGGESNASLERILLKSREDLRALRAHGVGGIGALVLKNVSKLPQFLGSGAQRGT